MKIKANNANSPNLEGRLLTFQASTTVGTT